MKGLRFEALLVVTALFLVFVPAYTKRESQKDNDSCVKNANSTPRSQPRPKSCLDYLRKGVTKCGYYKIYDDNGRHFPVYCDMSSEPGNAWTLIMSWSHKNRALIQFRIRFQYNSPVHESAPNWNMYRLTLERMKSIKSHSTHWRSTCSYPTHGIDYKDYVRGNFKDFDILNFIGSGVCKKVEFINIRNHVGIHTTARWWQSSSYGLHTDSSHRGCGFVPVSGSVISEDNFGYHVAINPNFRCTANDLATTQWWIGGHL